MKTSILYFQYYNMSIMTMFLTFSMLMLMIPTIQTMNNSFGSDFDSDEFNQFCKMDKTDQPEPMMTDESPTSEIDVVGKKKASSGKRASSSNASKGPKKVKYGDTEISEIADFNKFLNNPRRGRNPHTSSSCACVDCFGKIYSTPTLMPCLQSKKHKHIAVSCYNKSKDCMLCHREK